mmetsp:Transcript_18724/g.46630  ORF Transcript_18724/g.46630 Transcript_18724/m.46630 type:complete len:246 (+) Transcript_18724:636-1373(+)
MRPRLLRCGSDGHPPHACGCHRRRAAAPRLHRSAHGGTPRVRRRARRKRWLQRCSRCGPRAHVPPARTLRRGPRGEGGVEKEGPIRARSGQRDAVSALSTLRGRPTRLCRHSRRRLPARHGSPARRAPLLRPARVRNRLQRRRISSRLGLTRRGLWRARCSRACAAVEALRLPPNRRPGRFPGCGRASPVWPRRAAAEPARRPGRRVLGAGERTVSQAAQKLGERARRSHRRVRRPPLAPTPCTQ